MHEKFAIVVCKKRRGILDHGTQSKDGICSHNTHLSWLSVGLTLGDGVAS